MQDFLKIILINYVQHANHLVKLAMVARKMTVNLAILYIIDTLLGKFVHVQMVIYQKNKFLKISSEKIKFKGYYDDNINPLC